MGYPNSGLESRVKKRCIKILLDHIQSILVMSVFRRNNTDRYVTVVYNIITNTSKKCTSNSSQPTTSQNDQSCVFSLAILTNQLARFPTFFDKFKLDLQKTIVIITDHFWYGQRNKCNKSSKTYIWLGLKIVFITQKEDLGILFCLLHNMLKFIEIGKTIC